MPDVTRRRTGELLRNLFNLLMPHPDGLQARQVLDELRATVQLSEYEKGNYNSGVNRFDQIVRFSTVDCAKAGWLVKNKGRWSVTAEGKAAYAAESGPRGVLQTGCRTVPRVEESPTRPRACRQRWRRRRNRRQSGKRHVRAGRRTGMARTRTILAGNAPLRISGARGRVVAAEWVITFHGLPHQARTGESTSWRGWIRLEMRPPRIKVQVKRQGQSVSVDGLRSFMAVLGEDDVRAVRVVGRIHERCSRRSANPGEKKSHTD